MDKTTKTDSCFDNLELAETAMMCFSHIVSHLSALTVLDTFQYLVFIQHVWLSICLTTVFLFYPSHFLSVSFVSFGILFSSLVQRSLQRYERRRDS